MSRDLQGVADGWSQGVIASHNAVELIIEDIADGRFKRQPFFLAARGVGPQDLFGHLEPGCSALGKDLKTRLWQEAAGIAPGPTMVSAERDLGSCATWECCGKILEVWLRIGPIGRADDLALHSVQRIRERLEDEAAPIEEIAAWIDQEGRRRDLSSRPWDGVTIEAIEPCVPYDQSWRTQVCCQELLEPQGRRVAPSSKFGHENDAALLDKVCERLQFSQIISQWQCAIDRFAGGAGESDRVQPEPLARKEVNHVDVGPFDKRRQSFTCSAADLGGFELGASIDGIVNGRNPEAIFEAGQRWLVASLPQPAQSDDSHPEPLVLCPGQARLLATRSVRAPKALRGSVQKAG